MDNARLIETIALIAEHGRKVLRSEWNVYRENLVTLTQDDSGEYVIYTSSLHSRMANPIVHSIHGSYATALANFNLIMAFSNAG